MSNEGDPEDVVRPDTDDGPGQEGLAVSHDVLERDHVYEALEHPRRRYLCYTLLEDDEWSLSELAGKIAAWETDQPADEVSEPERQRVYVSLYHSHVPKLADCGVVSFDADAETLSTAENAGQVLEALQEMGASVEASQEHHARERPDADER
jgi:hypothetical protein